MKAQTVSGMLTGFLAAILLFPADTFGQGKADPKGPPPWAPAHGYRAKIRHIYFPDYNIYFDLRKGVYIYIDAGKWEVGVKIPASFGSIDLKVAAKFELELETDTPQQFNAEHKKKYKPKNGKGEKPKGKGGK